ncbi:MAG TPA: NAD(+) diphosphatase [Actinophytocola sp.]|uniref:NAD(+) diphosphatase n=1 Tax=Actinophytocola sp. TaxID=1872138 RepID=UPI002DDD370D|nr:NAD(+) diphosphatase [Actinophytocola sp.]HEV2778150.1 NAD(+) diphosphatase [Actinophytocola sp.]
MSGQGFSLGELPRLSRSTVDRNESVRTDSARTAELWARGRVILVDRKGRTPVLADGSGLVDRPAAGFGDTPPENAVLLGENGGVGHWAVPVEEELTEGTRPPPNSWGVWPGATSANGEQWHDLRSIGALLDDTSAGLFTTAVALFNWHARARFCAKCGAPTRSANAGWATRCTGCSREEYPRTDPAVICLVHDDDGPNGSHVLLARQPIWPPHRYSVLAGFVEAGESLEACVAREVREEVGVTVRDIRYLGSQPWPFPRSIMIGFAAVADRTTPLTLADGEIEDARWTPRSDIRAALDAGGEIPGLVLPGPTSIARQMLTGWANA